MNILQKAKELKRKADTLKGKAVTAYDKHKAKVASEKANEVKRIDSRLKELRRMQKTQKKINEINELERELTTSGKIMTLLGKGVSKGIKTAQDYHKQQTRSNRPRKLKKPRRNK